MRLENVFIVTLLCPPRRVQDVFKMCWKTRTVCWKDIKFYSLFEKRVTSKLIEIENETSNLVGF